jgi:zinc transport system ATP-binding protein
VALLTAQSLKAGYEGKALLPAVDLSIEPGDFWCLFGRNGSGKTTLLRTLLRLLPPVGGRLTHDPALRIGYVPQRHDVDLSVPSRVIDLVRTGLDEHWSFLRPFATVEQKQALATAMKRARVAELAREPYRELSEGQKQRVLLARALVTDPSLLVLDEPTSAMDHENENAVFDLLVAAVERGTSVLIITHDVERAANMASHAILVDKDREHAAAGPIQRVLKSKAFIHQYGAVFAVTTTPPTAAAPEEASA